MTQHEMIDLLAATGYGITGMHSDEIEELANAEGYVYNEDRNRYEWQG